MKYLDEYRDSQLVKKLCDTIDHLVTRPWTIMEVCGGQTHTIVRNGLDSLLPDGVRLIHGPGCPVCVTPLERIDRALAIAAQPKVIFCSFGDMLRVPGSQTDLLKLRAAGADVRIVYSPLNAVVLARENPQRQVVFFAVGFETTAPVTALAALQARRLGLNNFSLLVSHVLVLPALEALVADPNCAVQGFLAAGHVCTVMGFAEYEEFSARQRIPIVVTGFEPVDLLEGIWMLLAQLESGRAQVENQYARSVQRQGNPSARAAMAEVYEVCDQAWRGLGLLPRSGLRLRPSFADLDAEKRFSVGPIVSLESADCLSGAVLRGQLRPVDCPAFGKRCTPDQPLGAPMVSSEGACAAYYRYAGRKALEEPQP